MINIDGIIINEELIKVAIPHFNPPTKDWVGPVPSSTKIKFTDGTEEIYYGLEPYRLWEEMQRAKGIVTDEYRR